MRLSRQNPALFYCSLELHEWSIEANVCAMSVTTSRSQTARHYEGPSRKPTQFAGYVTKTVI